MSKKELSCASVSSKEIKGVPDKLCLTKVEQKRINNYLKKHEGKLFKKWVIYE